MKLTRLIAAVFCSAICAVIVSAQVPTPSQTAPAPKPTAPAANNAAGKAVVRLINTAAFRDGILELKAKREKLNTEFDPRNKKITDLQTQITALETELKNTQAMPPATRDQKMNQLNKLQIDYKYTVEQTNADATRRWQEETAPTFEKLDKFFSTYAAQRNITIVIDIASAMQNQLLVYAAPGLDITKEFMDEYNRAYPVSGANPPAPASTSPKR